MKLYTKAGDKGSTTNLRGESISKNDALIHFIGTVDELNAHLGLVKAMHSCTDTRNFLEGIQLNLMKLMAHASAPENGKYSFPGGLTGELEAETDRLSEKLGTFRLTVPGKSMTEAQIHIARTVARRAERLLVAACEKRGISPEARSYLNRLSDYLFALAEQDDSHL